MTDLVIELVYSFLLAVIYGLASYLRNSNQESFDIKAFVKTVIIGVFVGAVMYQQHIGYDIALNFVVTNGFLMTIIDKIINGIFQWKPPMKPPRKLY